jgi:excisionase family DNA binding protein
MEVPTETKTDLPPVIEPLLLTPEEAASALAIGRTKVYELLATGALRSVQIGACRRVPAQALQRFVDDLEAKAGNVTRPGTAGDATAGVWRASLASAALRQRPPRGREAAEAAG